MTCRISTGVRVSARHLSTSFASLSSDIWLNIRMLGMDGSLKSQARAREKQGHDSYLVSSLELSMNHSAALTTLISLCAPSRNQ